MPYKTVQQREQEWAERITADINAGIEQRFGKLEQAMERITAAVTNHATHDQPANTNSQKRPNDQEQSEGPSAKRVSTEDQLGSYNAMSHSSFSGPSSTAQGPFGVEQTPLRTQPEPHLSRCHPSGRFAELNQGHDLSDNVNKHGGAHARASASDNLPWAAWSTAQQLGSQRPPNTGNRPTSLQDPVYNDTIDSQVRQLLASSVHTLGKGKVEVKDFPYKYIQRGPEKVNATINSVSMAEHLWGMFRMLHDSKTDPDTKPCLMIHMEQIVEDGREFDWASGVRRWFEEVFSHLAEGRLVNGWHSYDEIQRLK